MVLPLLLILLAAADATPVPLAASACAVLPETGPVAVPAAPVAVQAKPSTDRHLTCPDDFRLDMSGRLPMCLHAGIKVVDGSPRDACYAAQPLGPIAAIAPRHRPTRTCVTPKLTTIVRIEAINAGMSDATVGVTPDADIVVATLSDSGPDVKQAENPVLQGCFAFACRLVKLTIGPKAAPSVELRLQWPGRDPVSQAIKLAEDCPH